MKIKTASLIILSMLFTQTVFAGPGQKLTRGVEGIVTSPMEFLNQYMIAADKEGPVATVACTLLGGIAMMGKRLINGVYDVVSFPVDAPKDYALLLADKADTAWQNYRELQNSCPARVK